MTSSCEAVKVAFVEGGMEAVRNSTAIWAHARNCAKCQVLLDSIEDVDALLGETEPVTVSAELMGKTLAAVHAGTRQARAQHQWKRLRLASIAASVFVAVAALSLLDSQRLMAPDATVSGGRLLEDRSDRSPTTQFKEFNAGDEAGYESDPPAPEPQYDARTAPASVASPKPAPPGGPAENGALGNFRDSVPSPILQSPLEMAEAERDQDVAELARRTEAEKSLLNYPQGESLDRIEVTGSRIKRADIESSSPVFVAPDSAAEVGSEGAGSVLPESLRMRATREVVTEDGNLGLASPARQTLTAQLGADQMDELTVRNGAPAPADFEDWRRANEGLANKDDLPATSEVATGQLRMRPAPPQQVGKQQADADDAATTTPSWLTGFVSLDVPTVPAEGYWANTYLPGDSEVQRMQARLAGWERPDELTELALERAVETHTQPADPPQNHALDLQLLTDLGAIEQPTRARIQVGLKAVDQRAARRPAMIVHAIFDVDEAASDDVRASALALLDGLTANLQTSDQASLVTTGSNSLAIGPTDFRAGPLSLVRRQLLGEAQPGPSLELATALAESVNTFSDQAGRADEGTVLVILIGGRRIADPASILRTAERMATAGIKLTVIPIADVISSEVVDELTRAGLGHRRHLTAPDQATALIERELSAAGSAVARAARLSIRLAPGVQLIDVVGSRPLDDRQSQQVRVVEQAVDQRLAANLGITADRGDDDDGIQIVIPFIDSGDDVVLLLDVIINGPGPVAEVSVRYKDLVFGRNNALRKTLALPRGAPRAGTSELAVTRSLLVYQLTTALRGAGEQLRQQRNAAARATLADIRSRLIAAQSQVAAWRFDPALGSDIALIEAFIVAIERTRTLSNTAMLADALTVAAWKKQHRSRL